MTTIKDVAAAVGVSEATVSRAVRGLTGVSAAVREEILRTAEALQYSASPIARSLASGPTETVAVLFADIGRWFAGQFVGSLSTSLSRAGYEMLVYDLPGLQARARFFARLPIRKRVDAVISVLTLTEAEVAGLRSLAVPVVQVGAAPEGFHSTDIDDHAAARTAVEHLLGLGHRRIASIGPGRAQVEAPSVSQLRREGYQAALRAAGLSPEESLDVDGGSTATGGARAMEQLLHLPRPPTAVFAHSDEMAFGALLALRRRGLDAPRDVSVVGFDDHELAEPFGLTTVAQPIAARAHASVRALVEALAGTDEAVPQRHVLPTRLLVRGTSGPPHQTAPPTPAVRTSKENP